jgi:hypothetical protein
MCLGGVVLQETLELVPSFRPYVSSRENNVQAIINELVQNALMTSGLSGKNQLITHVLSTSEKISAMALLDGANSHLHSGHL